ncbi:IPT/TIG domain-containing protein, partial [Streptomyces goshikiensis]|uniref:IPT/TIG domain-containing protein n=1 Tax=Streptomyces goshikiensis TaxID=1942 RepID=UPI0036853E92
YVTNNGSNTVSVIDTATNTVIFTPIPSIPTPFGLAIVDVPAAVPAVTGVAPASGSVTGGTTVTISGSGFTGATDVQFGSTAAVPFSVVSDTSITATVPAAAVVGQVHVTVTTPSGTSPTGTPDLYTYTPAPTSTSLVTAPVSSVFGQSVTLTATVTATAPGAGIPTGTVTFTDGITPLGIGALNASG